MELIEHIDPTLNDAFVAELRRVLKPSGVALITTPHKQTPELRSAYHTQEFSAVALQRLLQTRFERVEVYGYYAELTQHLYELGGHRLRALRLLWKTFCRVPLLNPFTRLSATPTLAHEHIIAVAHVDK